MTIKCSDMTATTSRQQAAEDWNEFFKRDQEEITTKVRFYDANAHSYDAGMIPVRHARIITYT